MKQQNTNIESTLQEAFQNATPDLMDSILAECENEKGRIITMTNKNKFKKVHKSLLASAACLALLLGCFAGYNAFFKKPLPTSTPTPAPTENKAVTTTVTLDVNPSLEIQANEDEKVMQVVALNEDAEIVIGNMELEGNSLELAINSLIGSMLQKGYINETTNSILVSIDSKDKAVGNAIKDRLSAEIFTLINTENIQGSVISQIVDGDDKELAALATQHGITLGKAKLIQTIVKVNPNKDFSHYAKLSIAELNSIMNASATAPDDGSIYIGEETALEIALNWRNITLDDLCAEPEIEIITVRGEICYQIQFKEEHIIDEDNYTSSTYVVYVNAITGKHPGDNVTEPNFTIEETWDFVCEELGDDAKNANILMQQFNNMESGLPMTYSFYFEIGTHEYYALVDAMNGVVIKIVEA